MVAGTIPIQDKEKKDRRTRFGTNMGQIGRYSPCLVQIRRKTRITRQKVGLVVKLVFAEYISSRIFRRFPSKYYPLELHRVED